MMTSNIPEDLVEEILSRVPVTSLKRLRSTCKRWNTLFKDRRFAEKHFCKAPRQSLILLLNECKICSVSVNLNVAPPPIEFKDDAVRLNDSPSNNSEQVVDIEQVFHCDGLLLCSTNDNRLVVWNPCLGETTWIQHKDGYGRWSTFALGYETTKSGRRYKILRSWWRPYKRNQQVDNVGFETYEFSSDMWRALDDVPPYGFQVQSNGVPFKGNTYWVVSRMANNFLVCFDFTKEKFIKRMCLPQYENYGKMALSVVGDEKLSFLHGSKSNHEEMDIWVTNKMDTDTEAALTWTKSFTVDYRICVPFPMSFLLDEEKKVALCCNNVRYDDDSIMVYTIGEDDKSCTVLFPNIEEESTDKPFVLSWLLNYVPSLVQIQQ